MADTSFFASDSTADLSADSTIQAQPHETGQPELSQSVGQAAHDPDETFDFFQAQGLRDAATLPTGAWVSLARATFTPSKRQACAVCGRYESLTHAHHVVPLAMQAGGDRLTANHEHEWLCPTHHAAVHVYILAGRGTATGVASKPVINIAADLPIDELRAVIGIAERAYK